MVSCVQNIKIMKTLSTFLIFLPLIISGCTKSPIEKQLLPPQPVYFEIVDQNAKSLITSKRDSVSITYSENGAIHSLHTTVLKLYASPTDTTNSSSKYNGLLVTDNQGMAKLEMQQNPIGNFNLSLNGVSRGPIHLDYYSYLTVYPQPSSQYFTFNSLPVVYDPNAGYVGVNLFKVQQ